MKRPVLPKNHLGMTRGATLTPLLETVLRENVGEVVTRPVVVAWLYGLRPPRAALASIRSMIIRLRGMLRWKGERIVTVPGIGWRLEVAL